MKLQWKIVGNKLHKTVPDHNNMRISANTAPFIQRKT
jgi:hypothetical protein